MAISETEAGVAKVNRRVLFGLGLIATSILIISWGLSTLPIEADNIAIDWKHIWEGTHLFQAGYGETELRTPPWALLFVWPITLLDLTFSWALAAVALLFALVLSVPSHSSKIVYYFSVFILVLSYPALRQIVDGNLEVLIIAGVLLAVKAMQMFSVPLFALSLLLLSAKIQESWLLLPALTALQWTSWPKRQRNRPYLISAGIALPLFAIFGQSWIAAIVEFPWPGSLIDSSLVATASRLNLSVAFTILLWVIACIAVLALVNIRKRTPSLESFSILVTASLLLGPYAASNSVLTPFALGVIPIFQKFRGAGLLLVSLYFLPYARLADASWRFSQESNYWTFVLMATLFAQIGIAILSDKNDASLQFQD